MIIVIDWNAVMQDFIVALVAGIIVSFSFIQLLLNFFTPKFVISRFICHTENKYRFKIVNKSIYHAYDAQIELFEMAPYAHSRGHMNVVMTQLKLDFGNMTTIPRYHRKATNKDPYHLYATLFFSDENITSIVDKSGVYLEMRLTVKHGLTGLAKTFVQYFDDVSVIKPGHKFCFGKKVDTMPENHAI